MVAGYYFQRPLLFFKYVPKTGLLLVIQLSYEGATNKKSPGSLRSLRDFSCPLPEASSGRGHKKSRTSCRTFFICAQDWIRTSTPFPALPPQGSASTNFATWARGRTNL